MLNDALGDGFERFPDDACVWIIAHTAGAIYMCMSSSELHTLQKASSPPAGTGRPRSSGRRTAVLGRGDYQLAAEPILYGWPEGARPTGAAPASRATSGNHRPRQDAEELHRREAGRASSSGRSATRARAAGGARPVRGSGTTLIAAERTGRKAALGMELDPGYVDVIVERWQDETGRDALLDGDGRGFAESEGPADWSGGPRLRMLDQIAPRSTSAPPEPGRYRPEALGVRRPRPQWGGDEASLPMPPDLPGGDQEDCGQRSGAARHRETIPRSIPPIQAPDDQPAAMTNRDGRFAAEHGKALVAAVAGKPRSSSAG